MSYGEGVMRRAERRSVFCEREQGRVVREKAGEEGAVLHRAVWATIRGFFFKSSWKLLKDWKDWWKTGSDLTPDLCKTNLPKVQVS